MAHHGHFAAISKSTVYNPLADPGFVEGWELQDLAPGAVAQTAGIKHGWLMRQPTGGNRPTYSATALVGPTGATAGGLVIAAPGPCLFCDDAAYQAAVAALGAIDVYAVVQKDQASAGAGAPRVIIEHSDNSTVSDGFGIIEDDGVLHSLEFLAHHGGLGIWQSGVGTAPLADPDLVMAGFALPGTSNAGSTTRRVNEIELPGANFGTAVTAGTFAAARLNWGSRANSTGLWFVGNLGGLWLYQTGTTSQRQQRAQYIASKYPGIITVA